MPSKKKRADNNRPALFANSLCRCRFHLAQLGRNLFQVRHHWDVVVLEPGHFSGFVHDSDRPAGYAFVAQVYAILLARRSPRMKIRQQRILDPHFLRIGLVRPYAVNTDAKHFRVQRLEGLHLVNEAGMLVGARRAPVQRVPHKYDVLLSGEIRKLYFLLFLIQQRKIRGRLSHRDTHTVSSSVSHISLSILPNPYVPHQVPVPAILVPLYCAAAPCLFLPAFTVLIPFPLLGLGSTLCSGEPYERPSRWPRSHHAPA